MITKALVVTRHPGLVEYLRNISLIGADAEVLEHATASDVEYRHVIGVLPHNLSCLTLSFTEVPLNLPADMRGKELTAEDVAQYAGEPVTYVVCRMKNPAGGFEALATENERLKELMAKRIREHQQEMTSFRLRVRSQDDATFAALREENERLANENAALRGGTK